MTPTQRASTHKRYYPGRDRSALQARPLIHHAGGDALQNETYRSLGEELIAACAKGVAAEEVARLLEAGADPSFVHDSAGRAGAKGHLTPLLQAIRSDSAEKVKLLLAAGANTTRTERNGNLPLVAAARRGKPPVVQALLDHGVDVDDTHDTSGQSALHVAAKQGHAEAVRLLCAAGANVDAGEEGDGATALHLAARYNRAPVVATLLEHGATIDSSWRDAAGKVGTPHHHAASREIQTILATAQRDARLAAAAEEAERLRLEEEWAAAEAQAAAEAAAQWAAAGEAAAAVAAADAAGGTAEAGDAPAGGDGPAGEAGGKVAGEKTAAEEASVQEQAAGEAVGSQADEVKTAEQAKPPTQPLHGDL